MVDTEKLRGVLAKAKSKSDHPEDVASARYQLKEWSMSAALPGLLDELERKTKALEAVRGICRNDGRGSAIVNERIVERCEEVAIAALKGTPQ